MPKPTPLVDRLVAAAADAIRAEEPGLSWDQHRLRGLTVELEIDSKGTVMPARIYTERSPKPGRRSDG